MKFKWNMFPHEKTILCLIFWQINIAFLQLLALFIPIQLFPPLMDLL